MEDTAWDDSIGFWRWAADRSPRGRWFWILSGGPAAAVTAKGEQMSYAQAKAFLAAHTQVLELTDGHGARVAVCPQWQGRVMTSTCDGPQGRSFGFIHREFIETRQAEPEVQQLRRRRPHVALAGRAGSSASGSSRAKRKSSTTGSPRRRSTKGPGPWPPRPRIPAHDAEDAVPERLGHAFDLDVTRDVRLLEPDDLATLFGPAVSARCKARG